MLELKPIIIEASDKPTPCVSCEEHVTTFTRHILVIHVQSHYKDGSQGMYQTKKIIGACSMECLKTWWQSPEGGFAEVCTPACPDECVHNGTDAFWHSTDPDHQPQIMPDGTIYQRHSDWDLHFRIHLALKAGTKAVIEVEAYLPTPDHVNQWWQETGVEELEAMEKLLEDTPHSGKPHTIDTLKLNPPTEIEIARFTQTQ